MSAKSFTTTLTLCLIAGVLGLHRFYVGKIVSGLAQGVTFVAPLILVVIIFVKQVQLGTLQGLPLAELAIYGTVILGNGLWVVLDVMHILSYKFTDAEGKRLR